MEEHIPGSTVRPLYPQGLHLQIEPTSNQKPQVVQPEDTEPDMEGQNKALEHWQILVPKGVPGTKPQRKPRDNCISKGK